MESFSRFAKNWNFNRNGASGRDASERARAEREYGERRKAAQSQVSIEQIKDTVRDCNEDQLDVIQDMFYDDRVERESSGKELLRAVDSNAKLLNKNFRLLNDIKDDMDGEEKVDIRSLSEENKEEILKAVLSNKELLDQIIENTDIIKVLKEELIDNKVEEDNARFDTLFDKETAEKAFIDLEDHVHKENVKCFRNVQEVIVEQDAQTYGKLMKGIAVLRALVIIAMVFGAANLAFIICWYLRLI